MKTLRASSNPDFNMKDSTFIGRIWALIIFIIALFTRTFLLDKFPYFPPEYPYLGDRPGPLGLYRDEAEYLRLAKLLPSELPYYQPWLHLVLIRLSIMLLGESSFSVRLPSAIASSLTALLIFLISRQLFKDNISAAISSLYYVVMFPSFVYGRMNFLENTVSMFLLLTIYLLSGRNHSKRIFLSGISAILAVLSKMRGVVAVMYYTVEILRENQISKRRKMLYLIPFLSILLGIIFTILWLVDWNISFIFFRWQIGKIGLDIISWKYLIIRHLPSGYAPGSYLVEYWYVFSYITFIYAIVKEPTKMQPIALSLSLMFLLYMLTWGYGSYHLIIMHSLVTIPLGYGVRKMVEMKFYISLLIVTLLYMPIVSEIAMNICSMESYCVNMLRYSLYVIAIAPIFLTLIKRELKKISRTYNMMLLSSLLIMLVYASYISPIFYPYYLAALSLTKLKFTAF